MSDLNINVFNERLKKIEVTRQERRKQRRFRWRGLSIVFIAVFGFKVTAMLLQEELVYSNRLSNLEQDIPILYYPLKLFQPEPLSRWIVEVLKEPN